MIGYVTLGVADIQRAAAFYDAVLGELGVARLWETPGMIAWAGSRDEPAITITKPFDGQPALAGNGPMTALRAASREQVDAVHARALAEGGKDEGPVGPRGSHGFYAGYFRDPDGNKLNVYVQASAP